MISQRLKMQVRRAKTVVFFCGENKNAQVHGIAKKRLESAGIAWNRTSPSETLCKSLAKSRSESLSKSRCKSISKSRTKSLSISRSKTRSKSVSRSRSNPYPHSDPKPYQNPQPKPYQNPIQHPFPKFTQPSPIGGWLNATLVYDAG